jgi:hypothetical protein
VFTSFTILAFLSHRSLSDVFILSAILVAVNFFPRKSVMILNRNKNMATQYTFQNLGQLSHTAGNIPFVYDRANDNYRPLEPQDFSLYGTEGSTSLDAFGRLKTSEPFTLFDSSNRYQENSLWTVASGVGGSSVFNSAQGLVEMNVPITSGAFVVKETTKVFAYQPAKSLLVMNSFVMAPTKPNLVQRVGYFGEQNGMYVEQDDQELNFTTRSFVSGSVQEVKVPQSNWNGDKLDGSGPSGLTLDTSKAQILWMDIEWLGVGTVRMGFVVNGKFILCHSFHHANLINSTYITTACLPLRYEIRNTAATSSVSSLKQICSSVISEGGYSLKGMQQAISTAVNAPYNLITSVGVDYPVITLRLKSLKLDGIAILSALSLLPTSTGNFRWKIVGRAVTSGGSGTWISASADSAVEYKQDANAITGGRTLASGFIGSTNQSSPSFDLPKDALFQFQLERDGLTNQPYELTLVVSASTATGGSPATVLACIDWEEISR